mgnify:FL=1
MDFASAGDDVSFTVEPGDFINVSAPDLGHTAIDVMAGRLNVETSTGASMTIAEGGALEVEVNDETGEMTVAGVVGVVTMTNDDGTTVEVEAGKSLGIVDSETEFSSLVMKNASDDEGGDLVLEEDSDVIIGDNFYSYSPGTSIPDYYGSLPSILDGLQTQEGGLPTNWSGATWTTRSQTEAYTDTLFGKDSGGNDVEAPTNETTTRDVNTATFSDNFGSQDSFAVVHTGFGADSDSGTLEKTVDITSTGYLQVIFDYNFVTAEFKGADATLDTFLAKLITESGTELQLHSEVGEVEEKNLTATSDLPSDTLDAATGGTTGWETYDKTYSIPYTATTNDQIKLSFSVSDVGDKLGDSAVLLDNIYLKFTPDADLGETTGQTFMRNDWTETNTNTDWVSSRVNAFTTPSFHSLITTPNARTPKAGAPFIETFGTNEAGGNNYAVIHTGDGKAASVGRLQWDFTVPSGGQNRTFSFDYNFITTEWAIASGGYNDYFKAELLNSSGGVVTTFANESNRSSTLSTLSTNFPSETFGGTTANETNFPTVLTGSQTGWQAYTSAAISLDPGAYVLKFTVQDAADGNATPALAVAGQDSAMFDSAVLLDNVVDPPIASPSTNYLLTFARMLSGEIDIHDADLSTDAVASAEHQAFVARVNEVISDMDNISVSAFMESRNGFLDKLWTAREIVSGHEETTEFLQKTAVAHHLLEANLVLNEGVNSTNLVAIADSLAQAKTFLTAHINDFGEVDALANIKTNIDSVLADIDNINNNIYTTDTLVSVRDGIKKAFSDTIDHMNGVCNDPTLSCYVDMSM